MVAAPLFLLVLRVVLVPLPILGGHRFPVVLGALVAVIVRLLLVLVGTLVALIFVIIPVLLFFESVGLRSLVLLLFFIRFLIFLVLSKFIFILLTVIFGLELADFLF